MMFDLAEKFFVGLGCDKMTDTFWEKSMIEKPDDRDVVCHASAEEFYKQEDFRIKMCTAITHYDLITIHHEMGHIVYFMEYKDQQFVYREAANPGKKTTHLTVFLYQLTSTLSNSSNLLLDSVL